MSRKKKAPQKLEDQYRDIVRVSPAVLRSDNESLEQPSPLKVVRSITTYGAYEEPILGN